MSRPAIKINRPQLQISASDLCSIYFTIFDCRFLVRNYFSGTLALEAPSRVCGRLLRTSWPSLRKSIEILRCPMFESFIKFISIGLQLLEFDAVLHSATYREEVFHEKFLRISHWEFNIVLCLKGIKVEKWSSASGGCIHRLISITLGSNG